MFFGVLSMSILLFLKKFIEPVQGRACNQDALRSLAMKMMAG